MTIRFVIGRDGAVSIIDVAGSDIPDAEVPRCVAKQFAALRFPAPEGGVVNVVYPIQFEPDMPRTPAPPGFFAGCMIEEHPQENGLVIDCSSTKVFVGDASAPTDEAAAETHLAGLEARFKGAAVIHRKRLELEGKTCWATTLDAPHAWTSMVIVPVGAKATRLVTCFAMGSHGASPWCERATAIFAKNGALKELLRTP
ncbi:hypothetical protein A7982_13962 [Minicystis rosea]|nr:hypothetical protein A7982_13962 [Minicystis rosea]